MKALLRVVVIALVCSTAVAEEQTWTPNFNNADIREVIRSVCEALEINYLIDTRVKGKIEGGVFSSAPLGREEYYDLFLQILDVNKFAAINSDGVLRIIPAKEAHKAPASLPSLAEFRSGYVTEIIHLKHISAPKVLVSLRPLLTQQSSSVTPYGNSALILSDTVANVTRIKDLLKQLDTASKVETEMVKLRYAHAEDLVETLNKLQKTSKADAQQQQQLTLVPESRTNSVLIKGDELSREEAKQLIEKLDRPGPQTGNIRVVYMKHGDAESIAQTLDKIIDNAEKNAAGGAQGGVRVKSSVAADPDTNSVIITADGEMMDSLMSTLDRLDIRRSNVLIEAVIAEVSDTMNRNLGVEWFFTDEDRGTFGSSSAAGTDGSALGALAAGLGADDSSTAIPAALAGIPGQTIGIGRLNSSTDFAVVLNALQGDTESTILATPYLTTLDNSEAEFNSGQEVPFVTGRSTDTRGELGNVFNDIERKPIGDILKVTPHVNQGGSANDSSDVGSMELEISLEVSSIADSGVNASDIITNKRTINTTIRMDDGEMIALGGLMRDNYRDVNRKVPLLGNIPILGRLFRNRSSELTQSNVVVFLRATILKDDVETYDFTAEKYDFFREKQLDKREESDGWIHKDQIPVLPEWNQPRPQPQPEPEQPQPEQPEAEEQQPE